MPNKGAYPKSEPRFEVQMARPQMFSTATFVLLTATAGLVTATAAHADSDSLFTLGVGAQYAHVPESVVDAEAAKRQFGVFSRVKMLRFLGAEFSTQMDEDPGTQGERLLSPRYQISGMINLLPTEYFNLFVVGGTGAHLAGDRFKIDGESTSLQAGPGLEIFLGDHVAIGADVRFRTPGPSKIREDINARIESEVMTHAGSAPSSHSQALTDQKIQQIEAEERRAVGIHVWQANFTFGVYL